MNMMMFIDQVDWIRSRTDIFDFLLRQPLDKHTRFLYGSKSSDGYSELGVYQVLIQNLNWILYSEKDLGWKDGLGIVDLRNFNSSDDVISLYEEDEIKRIYMEQMS